MKAQKKRGPSSFSFFLFFFLSRYCLGNSKGRSFSGNEWPPRGPKYKLYQGGFSSQITCNDRNCHLFWRNCFFFPFPSTWPKTFYFSFSLLLFENDFTFSFFEHPRYSSNFFLGIISTMARNWEGESCKLQSLH